MSMRITNKMMTSNTNININNNKVSLDRLNTQVSTQKKISRPSEDPVVAIRALRLRSSLSEISQYYEKNIPDAESWLEVTESALKETVGVITDMYDYCVQGSNDDLTATDRAKVLANLKELKDQVYASGNADYAGRTVFTGYRTGESLTYTKDTANLFSITEGFNASDIDTIKYISGKVDTSQIAKTDPQQNEVNRIRLAYDEMDATTAPNKIEYKTALAGTTSGKTATGFTITTTTGGASTTYTVTGPDASGNYTTTPTGTFKKNEDGTYTLTDGVTTNPDGSHTLAAGNVTVNLTSSGAVQNSYTTNMIEVVPKTLAVDGDAAYVVDAAYAGKAYYIAETGELILGTGAYATLSGLKDIEGADTIGFTYDKTQWMKGDLRPEHYFNCVDMADPTNPINHVYSDQIIAYDVSVNQSLRVNTLASEVYTHDITRDIDEMINATQAVLDTEDKIKKLKEMQSDALYSSDADQATLTAMLEEAEKERVFLQDKMENLFRSNITNSQGYLDQTNLAKANCGARGTKLELTETRMKEQMTSVNELASENENVDVATSAIELAQAELAYDAALLAAGKISQQTLLNYI